MSGGIGTRFGRGDATDSHGLENTESYALIL